MRFFSGTSGIVLPMPKYQFPAPFENASRLTYYASLFNSLEVNSCFYKIPQPTTIAKWAASVPEDFKFTFKLWRGVSHVPNLDFKDSDVADFMEAIHEAGTKQGCLLIQFPPGLTNKHFKQMDRLLHCIRKIDTTWKIAVEFRNKSWYTNATYDLLSSFKASVVIHDMPKSATPMIDHKAEFMYVRFHGPTGKYDGGYPNDFLSEYAGHVNDWMEEGKEVYMYFNNTIGDALKNLQTINNYVDQKINSVNA